MNKEIKMIFKKDFLTFLIDVIKLILPKIELIPAKCNLKIPKITELPA
jgi:hypothetical protein